MGLTAEQMRSINQCATAVPMESMADEQKAIASISAHLQGVRDCFSGSDPFRSNSNYAFRQAVFMKEALKVDGLLKQSVFISSLSRPEQEGMLTGIYEAAAESYDNTNIKFLLNVGIPAYSGMALGGVCGLFPRVTSAIATTLGEKTFLGSLSFAFGGLLGVIVGVAVLGGIGYIYYSVTSNPDTQFENIIESWAG